MRSLPAFDELSGIRMVLDAEVEAMTVAGRYDRKRLEDIIFELITMGYAYGIEVAGLDLEADIPLNADRMREVAMQPTAGETFADRIHHHINEAEQGIVGDGRLAEQLAVIAETETHRAINEGIMDGAEAYIGANPEATVYKQWLTMGDDRVRDTHDYLEGAVVPLEARYYSYDGDSALYPGDFMFAENNVNCRCMIRLMRA